MSRARWHILREAGAVCVARRVPVRFDIAAETVLPRAGKLRLAHQVRQDIWRALRRLRGFAPAVKVSERADGLHVRAGGQVDGAIPVARAEAVLARVLADPDNRARWVRWAQ